jgi:DNA-binding IclR family transcriptional regulator
MTENPSASDDASSPHRLSSVASALRLLKVFSADEPELGITTLAQRMGLAKSTIHRLTSTLVSEGFLEQNPLNEKYRLGLSLFGLGTLVRRRMNVSTEALEHLHELRDRTGETVHLAVLEQADIMYLFNLESQQAIGMRSYLGVRKPAFCSSEGRAILAFSPPAVVTRVLKSALLARTPHTITKPAALVKLLAGVAHAGYAVDDEESDAGMRGLAAPIRDASGNVIAAVGLAGPVQRLSKKNLRSFTPSVLQAAQAISRRLGYRPD